MIKKLMRILSAIIVCTCISGPACALPIDVGDFGSWATEGNRDLLIDDMSSDLRALQPDYLEVAGSDTYVPIEARVAFTFMRAMNRIATILNNTLVRFVIIFILVAYAFWVTFEIYRMMTTDGDIKKLTRDLIKRGVIISFWLILLTHDPAHIFMQLMRPVLTISSYISDTILRAMGSLVDVDLPNTCAAIRNYVAENSQNMTLVLDPKSMAELICLPSRMSGFFFTGIGVGFKWLLASIGFNVFAALMGLGLIGVFGYGFYKFTLMSLRVICDLFLAIIMLPFTAVAETVAKTEYKGIAGDIFNSFLELFKTQSLSEQVNRFINTAIYFVSLSIVVAIATVLLSGVINIDFIDMALPTLDSDEYIGIMLTAFLVGYLAVKMDKIASDLGGKLENSDYSKLATDTKKLGKKAWGGVKTGWKWVRGK